jgi:putative transposase
VTDKLRSYGDVRYEMGLSAATGGGYSKNNRAEKCASTDTTAKHNMQRSKSPGSVQRFLSVHAAVHNAFNVQRYLTSRKLRVLQEMKPSGRGEPLPRPEVSAPSKPRAAPT